MELANYKACICEGSAENAIMDILLDYNLLIFNREEMIEEEVIRCREAKKFEEKYLRKGFKDKISVIRILVQEAKILNSVRPMLAKWTL